MKKDTVKKIMRYLGKRWYLVLLTLLCALGTVWFSLAIPREVGEAIGEAVGPGNVKFDAIWSHLFRILIFAGAAAATQWLTSVVNDKISCDIVRDVRDDAFRHLQQLPLSYIDSHPHGETVSRIVADAEQFADGLLIGFTQLFTGILTIIGTVWFMVQIHLTIAVIVVVMSPLSLFAAAFIAKKTHGHFALRASTRAEATALTDEMIENQKLVRAFAYEDRANERYAEVNERLRVSALRATFYSSITNPTTRLVNALIYAAVALAGALAVIDGNGMEVAGLVTFLSYATQFTKPFNEISGVLTEVQNAFVCAGRVFDLIDEESETPDDVKAVRLPAVSGDVSLDDVSFSYDKEKELLSHISVSVKAGQTVAIVGPTGCGKTTLINLLMRFYDADEGAVRVDGEDVRNITRESLRRNFGMVLQDTWIRSGTVRENIALGRPDASFAEIIDAAKAVHVHSFIKRLPEGYDTVIDDESGCLSRGERQLLCIARVMLALPPMLILDEATSSIDTRTELRVRRAFDKMMKGRTCFIVAHRLSTVEHADLILVMRDGDIVEKGTHEELLAQGGFYRTLYESQFVK